MSTPQSDSLTLREAFRRAHFFGKTALLLSSWFGVGLMPKAPGTFGTLAALPLAMGMYYMGGAERTLFLILLIATSVWSADLSERLLGRDDPSEVVIDEAAGFLLTVFLLPRSRVSLCIGFALFRLFDIVKPFPIRTLEKRVKGGMGIVLDDLLAGLYASLCVKALFLIFF